MEELPEQGGVLKEIAIVHATLGDLDTAYRLLDRVLEEDPGSIGLLASDPTAEPLRSDPRWGALMESVGLD